MVNINSLFKKLIADSFSRNLQPLSFYKLGDTFYRDANECKWIIEIQKSQWCKKDEIDFTVNIGVYIPRFWGLYATYEKADEEKPSVETSAISTRIGLITGKHKDLWWNIFRDEPNSEIEKTLQDVFSLIIQSGLPFLDSFHYYSDVIAFLENSDNEQPFRKFVYPQSKSTRLVYAGIIEYLNDNGLKALVLVNEALKHSTHNSAHIIAVRDRLEGLILLPEK